MELDTGVCTFGCRVAAGLCRDTGTSMHISPCMSGSRDPLPCLPFSSLP